MRSIWIATVLYGLLLCSAPAVLAHHSFAAEFDKDKPIAMTGVVTKVLFENPHTYVYLDVKDGNGNTENWAIEGGSTTVLYRQGWRKDSVKPGDTISVTGFRAKNGRLLASGRKYTLPDGRQVFGGATGDSGPGSDSTGEGGGTGK